MRRLARIVAFGSLLLAMVFVAPMATAGEPLLKRAWHYRQSEEGRKADAAWDRVKRMVGKKAPELRATDWRGRRVSIESCKGKIVVLDFWATWCKPCIDAFPKNRILAKKYRDEVVLIGLCHPEGSDRMNKMAAQQRLRYPLAVDTGQRDSRAYGVEWYPYYVVIDQKGIIRDVGIYPSKLEKAVEELLKEAESTEMLREMGDAHLEPYLMGNRTMRLMYNEMHGEPAQAWPEGEWIAGEPAPLEEQRGKVVLLEITYLSGSRSEKSASIEPQEQRLNPIVARYDPEEVAVVGLVLPNGKYDVESFVEDNPTDYPLYLVPPHSDLDGYNYFGRAIYHVIDRDGNFFAAGVDAEHLATVVDLALRKPAQTPPEAVSDPGE